MGGGFLIIGIGALFAFYGMRIVRDKSTNYRFTKGLTLLGLTMVCWGTFPQAQRFSSGTQIFAQLIVGLLFFGVGGALVGFLVDWYRRQDNRVNPAPDPESRQGGEWDSKAQTRLGSTSQLNRTYQSKTVLSAADLVRLEQITSLRDRGTLSQSQFEMERDIILGAVGQVVQDADGAPMTAPPPPPPTPPSPPPPSPPESLPIAGTSVQKGGATDVGFIAVMVLPLLIMGVVIFGGATESSPEAEPAIASDVESPSIDSNAVSADASVANCYGSYERENWSAAVVYCSAAAEQGDLSAQHNLGFMYADGNGVTQDYAAAAFWFSRAAAQGDAFAQTMLGALYYDGLGVPKNSEAAAIWYGKAAEQGNAPAQYNLGLMYENGDGVNKDLIVGVSWLRKAAEQGQVDAKNRLTELGY